MRLLDGGPVIAASALGYVRDRLKGGGWICSSVACVFGCLLFGIEGDDPSIVDLAADLEPQVDLDICLCDV